MRIVTAFTPGSDFKASHVQSLARQCAQFAPGVEFVCITNEAVHGVTCWPNRNIWPRWWVKMEAFAPDIYGKILFMDLDTVVRGSLADLLKVNKLTMLRDFYRDGRKYKEGLQSSLMLLPDADRAEIWDDWIRRPHIHMQEHVRGGDQVFLEKHFLKRAQRWQDVLPGQIVSAKVDCGAGNAFRAVVVPTNARVIVFHGKPRPWDCPEFEELYAV